MDSTESPTKLIEPKIEPSPLSSSSSSSSSLFRGLPAGDAGEGGGSGIPRPLESLYEAPIPPFLSKTYDLVDDPALDALISWGPRGCTFVVWDPSGFAQTVLPRHFKHSNFSSFVRQLNTYLSCSVDCCRSGM